MHWRWGAKHAIAQTFISIPVWNCLFLMSQTPWTGVAIALFWKWQGEETQTTKHCCKNSSMVTKTQLCFYFPPTRGLPTFSVFLCTVQTSVPSYGDHSITVATQLVSWVKNKARVIFIISGFLQLYKSAADRSYTWRGSQNNTRYVTLTRSYISTVTSQLPSEFSQSDFIEVLSIHSTK